jgi:membrane associated rhomboid family serine protease
VLFLLGVKIMVQAVMANQGAKLNEKKSFVSIKFAAAIGGLTGGLFLMLTGQRTFSKD